MEKDIQKYRLILSIVLTIIGTPTLFAQNIGDFRSKGDGPWGTHTTWERFNGTIWEDATAGQFPGETNSVWIQVQHTVTINSNRRVLNLHLSAGIDSNGGGCISGICSSFLILGANSLEVYGFMRSYHAAVGTTPNLGSNDFSSSIGVSQSQIQSEGAGGIIVKGNSRTFLNSGAWAANHNSFRIVFDVNQDAIITIASTFKARRIIIRNGTVNSGTNRLSADGGGASGTTGVFIIEEGGKLISSRTGASTGLQVISKGGDSACQELRIEQGGILELLGENPRIAAANIINNGSIIYARNGNQTLLQNNSGGVPINTYSILKLTGTGTKTLPYAITVNDSLIIQQSASINRNSLTINAPANFTLVFRGSSAQTTNEENWPDTSLPNLVVDNPHGLSLHEAKTITNKLTLLRGNINTTSHLLTLNTDATIEGGSINSFVAGPLAHAGSGEKFFPIGKGEIYRPANANISGTSHTYSIELIDEEPIGNPIEPLTLLSNHYHWRLLPIAGSLSAGSIEFTYDPEDIPSDDEDIRIGFSSSISGDLEVLSTLENSEIGKITVSVNPSGVYGLGSINPQSTLPVVWKSFNIEAQNQHVLINWETSFEKNVSHFEILKSEDSGRVFSKIAEVIANGNSISTSSYSYTDTQIWKRRNFYKIRQIDIDGSSSSTEVKRIDVDFGTEPKIWTSSNKILYVWDNDSALGIQIQIYSSTGKVVYAANIDNSLNKSERNFQIPLLSLKGGMYWVVLNKNSQTFKQKIWLAY